VPQEVSQIVEVNVDPQDTLVDPVEDEGLVEGVVTSERKEDKSEVSVLQHFFS